MLGTPTQAARDYYHFFHPDWWDSLTGEDLFQIDMGCLSEYNRLEAEEYEKQRKDGDFKAKHPGAENYPDKDTMWAKARAATKKEG